MQNVHTTRLLLTAAAIELATGVSLYVFPRDFSSAIYAPVLPYFPYLSAALLAGGLLLLMMVRYAPSPGVQRALAVGAAIPVILLARYILEAGGYTGATSYLFLVIGILAAAWVTRAAKRSPFDLFSLTLGSIHLVIGLLMLGAPYIFRSPAFGPIRPALPGIGLLSLVGAALLLSPQARRILPLATRRAVGVVLPGILSYTFLVTGAWTGVVMWVLWAVGSLLESHPVLATLRRTAPQASAASDDDWSARAERSAETWSWMLMLVVVVVTSFLGSAAAHSMPRAFLFVLVLGGYNIAACWLLPPLGTARLRLHAHLLVLAAAIGVLLSGATPVASALLPVLLAIPMISARSGGRSWGFAMLGAVLMVLLLSGLMDLWVDQLPFQEVMANLAIQLVTLGTTGAAGVTAAANQRATFSRLAATTRDLVRSNANLQTANEELMAQSEELMAQSEELSAQQEELISQHQKLTEQSLLLATQRDELLESETRFRAGFENGPIGMAMLNLDQVILKANRALGEMLGYDPAELVGRPVQALVHPDDEPKREAHVEAVLTGRAEGYQLENRFLHRDGTMIWVNANLTVIRDSLGFPLYLLSQIVDITERHRAEEQLRHLANYDPLTDLINRRRFQEMVETELEQAGGSSVQGALLFLDFDQFKFVNDTLGHRAGDDLLRSLARVLADTLGERGFVARLGGDEFAVLVPDTDAAGAEVVATEVLSAVRAHMEVIGGQPVGITVSIGIALYPEHGQSVEELMLHADLAMYQAKESGRNRHRIYASGDREVEMSTRLNWERRIREALKNDQFLLQFQPILDLRTGQVMQYEALLRMVDTDGTLISPRQFLGVAESYGLIHAIDRWVVRRVIRTLAAERHKRRRLDLGINLSARAFSDPELLPLIQAELLEHDVSPSSLHFEITETAAVADMAPAEAFIETLTGLGCQFALDDFGAGFSSLLYLKQLPVSCLKIDGSFIERLPSHPVDQKMVKAVVTLARELGMRTVAEYVSCDQTLELLRELGVDGAQGYHIGPPGPLPE
ncbi:MAG: putative bifunctional diguanylate cyclase/phosphodiesterase [Bacillota bacterium]